MRFPSRTVAQYAAGLVVIGALSTPVLSRADRARSESPGQGPPSRHVAAADAFAGRQAMLTAEDGRAPDDSGRAPLFSGLGHQQAAVRQAAVRGLGRLEDTSLVKRIAPLIADKVADVRAEAANALAQAVVKGGEAAATARELLLRQVATERDPGVAGAIAEALGRIPISLAIDAERVERALVARTWRTAFTFRARPSSRVLGVDMEPGRRKVDAALPQLTGAVRGLEAFVRRNRKSLPPSKATLDRLGELVVHRASAAPKARGAAAPVRRLALAALLAAGPVDARTIDAALRDPDWQVRRLAMTGAASAAGADQAARTALIQRGFADSSPHVRVETLRAWTRGGGAPCEPLVKAANDADAHVRLAAIDTLATCGAPTGGESVPANAPHVRLLVSLAQNRTEWQTRAHALVALASVAPGEARPLLAGATGDPSWQARMYAARAAAAARETPVLEKLAGDAHANVREAASSGLAGIGAHQFDAAFIAALGDADYQLVQTAARSLKGAPDRGGAVAALVSALRRLSAEKRDTSRDPRVAILERLRELGSAADAEALAPMLSDFDPRVARLTADVLTAWTGTQVAPGTARATLTLSPPIAEIDALGGATLAVTMKGGGTFTMRLFVDEAPATVWRVVRLARAGYYDGLTFHRIVPNFVIQGGSPGANEFMGDGAYMRDEVGRRSHARGTVGISTRGRDTGDAQIFVNLVDNPRLDHDYTVFAEITSGIEVVDTITEGDVMARVRVVPRATVQR